ncbi:MAG: DUF3501 family protein [Thermoprotei archaeon]|jgi:hypothetical protein
MSIYSVDEFLTPERYEEIRIKRIKDIAELKKSRRIDYGERFSFLFENRETVKHQIQETIYLDNLQRPEDMIEVINTYEPMVPSSNELSLTVFINIYNEEEMRTLLPRFKGIENSISLRIDDRKIKGEPIYPEKSKETTRSIHYLKFKFSPSDLNIIKGAKRMSIIVEHPEIRDEIEVPQKVLLSVIKDLNL